MNFASEKRANLFPLSSNGLDFLLFVQELFLHFKDKNGNSQITA